MTLGVDNLLGEMIEDWLPNSKSNRASGQAIYSPL